MNSKEDAVLELFFNSSRHWHFDELWKTSKLSRSRLTEWLKKFRKQGLITRIKPKGRMPFYVANVEDKTFQISKKNFALKRMTEIGFLQHLANLEKAKTIILFGSLASSDWTGESDIDLFIYGDNTFLERKKFETLLRREIQIHHAQKKEDLIRMDKLLPYVLMGNFIKGSIEDLDVTIHAKT